MYDQVLNFTFKKAKNKSTKPRGQPTIQFSALYSNTQGNLRAF
jgi:hypothetical protein